MSITREQLKVGETFLNELNSDPRIVLCIGKDLVFSSSIDRVGFYYEGISSIGSFLSDHSIIKPEPKKLGEVAWFLFSNGEINSVSIGSSKFQSYSESCNYERVTLKDNEIWEFYEEV